MSPWPTPEFPAIALVHTHSFLSLPSLPEGVPWQQAWAQLKRTAGRKCQELRVSPRRDPYSVRAGNRRISRPAPMPLGEQILKRVPLSLSEGPPWDRASVIRGNNCSFTHPVLACFPALSHFPHSLFMFPKITSKINDLTSNPCVTGKHWGDQH